MPSSYYFSYPTYQMCSGNLMDSLNLSWNQYFTDWQARHNLYMFPTMQYGNFDMYQTSYAPALSYLLDPNYTLMQMKWKYPGFNWDNPQVPIIDNSTPGPGTDSSMETAEDIAYKRNYNKLLALCKQLVSSGNLNDGQKDALNLATRNTSGTWKEKFDKLKEAYDEIDKATVKKFLSESKAFLVEGINGSYEANDSTNSFYYQLLAAGYEYSSSEVDNNIDSLEKAIADSKTNGNQETACSILGHLKSYASGGSSSYSILDVISSWNTKYSSDSSKRNIIKYIAQSYDSADSAVKKEAKQTVLEPIVKSLTRTAREFLDSLDEESQNKMKNAIDAAETALSATDSKVDTSLAEAFDDLYKLTREASVVILENKVISTYGSVDKDVFNEDLFIQETVNDLTSEFGSYTLQGIKVSETLRQRAEENANYVPPEEVEENTEVEEAEEEEEEAVPVTEVVITPPAELTAAEIKDKGEKEDVIMTETSTPTTAYLYNNHYYTINDADSTKEDVTGKCTPAANVIKTKGKTVNVTRSNGEKLDDPNGYYEYHDKIYYVKDNNVQDVTGKVKKKEK